jgi:cytochrome P450/NADPH-cytochrome P450 reductase
VINSVQLLSELCDETRFHKHVSSGLERIRAGTNDGLFTAHDNEKNWETAHRLLVPAFGPLRIREMFPQMNDIAQQLCLKWCDCSWTTVCVS